jgi:PAS domain-containing protein
MEEFRTLAEAMPQIVSITRAGGLDIYFNQHWMDYTGLTVPGNSYQVKERFTFLGHKDRAYGHVNVRAIAALATLNSVS